MKKGEKIYISGAITGNDNAKAEFEHAEQFLLKRGCIPVNPMKLTHDHDKNWESYMKECIVGMMTCESVLMIEKWEFSKGALIEYNLAKDLNMKIYYGTIK